MADAALASAEAIMADAKAMNPDASVSTDDMLSFETPQTAMVSFEQRQLYKSKASEALTLAKDALVSFRRANESDKKVKALKVVVDANVAMEKTFDAMMAASDELAMIKRLPNSQKQQVEVAQMLAEVQILRGDGGSASQSLNDALDLQRELGNKAGEAKVLQRLAAMKVKVGKSKEGLSLAQQSLGLYQDLRDTAGQDAAKKIVNRAYAESGQTDKAPNRSEALKALEDLASAVERSDKNAWTRAIGDLNKSSAYTQQDVQEIFGEALKKDRRSAAAFLQQMGVRSSGSAPELVIKEVTKVFSYIGFRIGGLGYGPRFRCLNPTNSLMVKDDYNSLHAVACLQISDEADDWERELQYHPGILDGCLQSQSALG
eukprot:TRINITY_DN10146_c0_g1_i2.p1 TRINITY_DN10146_c0_g1~~TRINITY_DN10146_c0_g1_i2.p1  ORF type:complete len:374 (+),score=121.25 TRINITY_DN10146_c0_g1_i2:61-1182(+)